VRYGESTAAPPPVVDAAAKTLAIDATAGAPVLLKVTR